MKIKGQFQWTDYLNAQLLHMQPTGIARGILYSAVVLTILGFILLFFLALFGQFDLDVYAILPLFILAGFYPLYRYVFLPKRIRKLFTQQKELSSPIEFELAEAGLTTSNEFGNSIRPWTYFIKWKENKELIMLYHSDVLFNMIPKRFFADPQQIETVRSFLQQNKVPTAQSRFLPGCVIYLLLPILIAGIMYMSLRNTVYP